MSGCIRVSMVPSACHCHNHEDLHYQVQHLQLYFSFPRIASITEDDWWAQCCLFHASVSGLQEGVHAGPGICINLWFYIHKSWLFSWANLFTTEGNAHDVMNRLQRGSLTNTILKDCLKREAKTIKWIPFKRLCRVRTQLGLLKFSKLSSQDDGGKRGSATKDHFWQLDETPAHRTPTPISLFEFKFQPWLLVPE